MDLRGAARPRPKNLGILGVFVSWWWLGRNLYHEEAKIRSDKMQGETGMFRTAVKVLPLLLLPALFGISIQAVRLPGGPDPLLACSA